MPFERIFICVALLLAWPAVSGRRTAAAGPTFNGDVAPILFNRCARCHRPNHTAPMPLLSYKDVRPWAQGIRKKVISREMPPWYADPRFGRFRNDPSLTQQEIDTILAWVDSGALEGSDPLPPPPRFAEGWNHPSGRPPDVVVEMPFEFTVPADGQLPTFNIYSKLPPALASEDHFVEAVQLLPSNISAVHHSTFSMRRLPAGLKLGTARAWPGGPILSNVPIALDRTISDTPRLASAAELFSSEGTAHFIFYLPGNNGFAQFHPGVGKRIRREDYIEWSVHYTPSGRVERDRQRAGLWLQRVPPTHEMITLRIGDFHIVNGEEIVLPTGIQTTPGHAAVVNIVGLCNGAPCSGESSMIPVIPPYAENWKITAITPVQDDVTLYLAYPHGHLRLKDMTYVATYPDGREETLLSVPKFDFNWQLVYEWLEPIQLPAGSTMKVIGHYDNSINNKWNPAPHNPVYWSEQSWDEMFNGFIDLSIDKFDLRLERQQPRSNVRDSHQPEAPVVIVGGCVERRSDGAWNLNNASEPRLSSIVHADANEIEEARTIPLGTARYHVIGTAEFASADELLGAGQRSLFTTRETANTTGLLRTGRRVAAKALLITAGNERRLNLLSLQSIADSCR